MEMAEGRDGDGRGGRDAKSGCVGNSGSFLRKWWDTKGHRIPRGTQQSEVWILKVWCPLWLRLLRNATQIDSIELSIGGHKGMRYVGHHLSWCSVCTCTRPCHTYMPSSICFGVWHAHAASRIQDIHGTGHATWHGSWSDGLCPYGYSARGGPCLMRDQPSCVTTSESYLPQFAGFHAIFQVAAVVP